MYLLPRPLAIHCIHIALPTKGFIFPRPHPRLPSSGEDLLPATVAAVLSRTAVAGCNRKRTRMDPSGDQAGSRSVSQVFAAG